MEAPTPIFFAHANGFPADAYRTFFDALAPHPVDAIPILGAAPFEIKKDFHPVVQQVQEAIAARHQAPVIGLGHSLGAVALLRLAVQNPALFSHLILIDPPLFGWKRRYMLWMARSLGLSHRISIARKAFKRRDHFADLEEARAYWGSKRFFASFHSACFEDYIQSSLMPAPEGGLTLRIPAQMEGRFFTMTAWRLGDTRVPMPAHYIIPSGQGVLNAEEKLALPRSFPDFEVHTLPGGHMLPLETPEATATFIKGLVQK